jgi:LysM repeat protein
MSMNNDPEFVEYTVQSDDTLWDIAEDYDISVEDILEANADLDPDNLYVGQVIYLPADSELEASQRPPFFGPERRPFERRPFFPRRFRRRPFACRRFYTVRPGDTLYRLSFRFGLPVRAIVRANPNINFGFPLEVGETICIPF